MPPLSNAAVADRLSDRLADLGDISPQRVIPRPAPGSATLEDVRLAIGRGEQLEWIDGTLVEKAMGWQESMIAALLIEWLGGFSRQNNLGLVTGPDGFVQILGDVVRAPDVAFISWDRLPGRRVPQDPVPACVPDLAVEVLSVGNTRAEMARKRREYFHAGVRLVWMIDLRRRTVAVYTGSNDYTIVDDAGQLDGGDVLPGLTVDLGPLFAELDREPPVG